MSLPAAHAHSVRVNHTARQHDHEVLSCSPEPMVLVSNIVHMPPFYDTNTLVCTCNIKLAIIYDLCIATLAGWN